LTELPSGTVTFLFTDIEGSTVLLKALGHDRYAEALGVHDRIVRSAVTAYRGQVVDTQGDALFVAFATAADAVAAAVDAQRDLTAERWPDGATVRVRMGLHTGEPRVGEQRYVGIGVHRAARIAAAGHGGQVLLSSTTRELAEEDLSPGVSIRDLGERRLKDIDQPQHLYQLVIVGLQSDFGQLRTLDVELRRRRRRMYASSAAIGVVAAAVAIPVFAFGQGGSPSAVTVQGDAVAAIDPGSNRVVGAVSVGARPSELAAGSGSLWVLNRDDRSVSRIDPTALSVTGVVRLAHAPTGLAAVDGATWVVGTSPTEAAVTAARIDPQFNVVSKTVKIEGLVPGELGSAAASGNILWIAPSSGRLTRLDARTGRVVQVIDPGTSPTSVVVGEGATWVADRNADTVTRIDLTGLRTAIPVGHSPAAITVGMSAVWVVNALDDQLARIDPATRSVTTTIPVGRGPSGIAVGSGSVWVANSGDGTVSRVDPERGRVIEVIHVGGSPQSLVYADHRVWVSVDRQALGEVEPGRYADTLRLSAQKDIDSMDPALADGQRSWQLLAASCARLLNYPDKPAPAGARLIPEVAQALPRRSADGKTYTFTIRKGFRFSPPSRELVTAQTFRHAIERSLNPAMRSGGAQYYLRDVAGARAYTSGRAAHISGLSVRGDRLTIRLTAAAPDFLLRLAVPFFCAVPLTTPIDPDGVRVIPSAGPYYVTSYIPGQGVILRRNPNYTGRRPHHVERIELSVGVAKHTTDALAEAGTTDYAFSGVDRADLTRLAARFGAHSEAARRGKQQYFVNPTLGTEFVVLNTRRHLFADVHLREAVNYAIDRRALAKTGGAYGATGEQPTDQTLPPNMPGFKDAHIYPFSPNITVARRLAGTRRRTAILYSCNKSPCDEIAQILTTNLAAIGIDVVTKIFAGRALVSGLLTRPHEPFDLSLAGWGADSPDAGTFLNPLALGAAEFPAFGDSAYRRKLAAVAMLTGADRTRAYGALDADLARNAAPWVAISNPENVDFFSARVGCQTYQPVTGMDLAALCIRP
jgi:YVTN family beta-propeller protein